MKGSAAETGAALTLFALLWALAVLFHQAKWSHWLETPASFALSVAAAVVLLRPSSLLRLCLLAVVQLWKTAEQMPWVSNHVLLMAFVNATILLAFVNVAIRNRLVPADRAELFRAFAPAVRVAVLLVYFWSAAHKLNVDWFDPAVSCAVAIYGQLADRLPLLPRSMPANLAAIYGASLVEAAIPFFLMSARLRHAGLLLAGGFHLLLGIAGFFNFSAVMYATLWLFVPEAVASELAGWRTRAAIGRRLADPGLWRRVSVLGTAVLIGGAAVVWFVAPWTGFREPFIVIREPGTGNRSPVSYAFEALWWVYSAGLSWLLLRGLGRFRADWPGARELLAMRYPSVAVVPLLVFLSGLSPYLGLRTETTFSMFSNLRTEGETTNHILIRRGRRLAGYQDDLVTIVRSSDPELQRLATKRYLLPYFALRTYLSARARLGHADIELEYARGGVRRSISDATRDPELSRPYPFALRNLLHFRPVRPAGTNTCQH